MPDLTFGLQLAGDQIAGKTVQGMDVDKLSTEQLRDTIQARLDARNRFLTIIGGELWRTTTQGGSLIGQEAATGEWKIATEQTRGMRRRTEGLTAVGFPLHKYEIRSGWSRDYLAVATNTDILRVTDTFLAGHWETQYKEALRALFTNTNSTWSDPLFQADGTRAVKPLVANLGDYIPPEWQGNTFAASHTHYLATGDGNMDEADFLTAANHLREHGFGVSTSVSGLGGRLVVWIAAAKEAEVRAHTNFVAANDPIVIDANKEFAAVGDQDQYIGYNTSARCWIRVVPWMPTASYLMFATNAGGENPSNDFAPLARRIPPVAGLQGVRLIEETRYPLEDAFWEDWVGYGVYNRISAICGTVGASYVIPTF